MMLYMWGFKPFNLGRYQRNLPRFRVSVKFFVKIHLRLYERSRGTFWSKVVFWVFFHVWIFRISSIYILIAILVKNCSVRALCSFNIYWRLIQVRLFILYFWVSTIIWAAGLREVKFPQTETWSRLLLVQRIT